MRLSLSATVIAPLTIATETVRIPSLNNQAISSSVTNIKDKNYTTEPSEAKQTRPLRHLTNLNIGK